VEDPSLPALLARLRRLRQRGPVVVRSGEVTDLYEVMLFPPATAAQITAAQAFPGKRLPDDFLQFWRFSNGANLFVNESGLHGVGVASTELLPDLQKEEVIFYGPEVMEPFVVFARVNGAGDFLVLDLRSGQILDGVHAEKPNEWRPIAASFTHWLEQFLEAQGRYFWIEALYDSARTSPNREGPTA
jgi:hypothetical protein